MFCSNCGTPNADAAKFCTNCGNPLRLAAPTNAEVPKPATADVPKPVSPAIPTAPAADVPKPPASDVPQPSQPSESALVLPASIGQRLLHTIVDSIAMWIFAIIAAILGGVLFGEGMGALIVVFAFFGYHLIFEAIFQKTVGKMFTGTKVVNLHGEKPSFGALVGRSLCRYIPFEAFSFLFYGSYPTKGWHDRFSGTLVVPDELTAAQVRAIDPEKAHAAKSDSAIGIVLIVLIGGFFVLVIIGILASVVLASLNDARAKGADAAIRSTLSNLRAPAELYYFNNGESYAGFCSDDETTAQLYKLVYPADNYVCNDDAAGYAISASLNEAGYFCVDGSGQAKVIYRQLSSETSCR